MNEKKFPARDNPQLYEINTCAWLYELSQKSGKAVTLGNVPTEEWEKLKKLGFDFVWLMGIWQRSSSGRNICLFDPSLRKIFDEELPGCTDDQIIGSSYSISAYDPDPMIGEWEEIDSVHTTLNRIGIGLILDFIPNHTGTDYPWVFEHPEYYIQGSEEDYNRRKTDFLPIANKGKTIYLAHGKDPYFPCWTDTLQLNYFNFEARLAILDELEKIAGHCDGVRCDMSMLVLNDIFTRNWSWANTNPAYTPPAEEFWTQAISRVPGLIWIAEGYWDTEPILQRLGFDYVYDKKLFDLLRGASIYDVYHHLKQDIDSQKKLMRFLENHDERRIAATLNKDQLRASVVVFATLPGMKLYYHGQLEGKKIRLPLQLCKAMNETPDIELRAFYEKVLAITDEDIFHAGAWELKEVLPAWDNSFKKFITYRWLWQNRLKIVVVNLSPNWSQCNISFKGEVQTDRSYTLVDELSRQSYIRSGAEMNNPGLHVLLDGYRAHVFDIALDNQ